MTTFWKLKKLMDLRQFPEPETRFWDSYLPALRKRIELEPVPLYLRFTPVPLISFISIALISITILTTINLYSPPVLGLENIPQTVLVSELKDLDYFITENFEPETIIQTLFPERVFSPTTGGEYYEIF